MRKITFLLLMLCCTVAKAETLNIDLTSKDWSAGNGTYSNGTCIINSGTDGWNGYIQYWFGNVDYSKYSSFTVSLGDNVAQDLFVALYNTSGSEIKTGTISNGNNSVTLDLSECTLTNVQNLVIKNIAALGADLTFTLSSVCFTGGPSFTGSGSSNITLTADGDKTFKLAPSLFANYANNATVSLTASYTGSDEYIWLGAKIVDNTDSWGAAKDLSQNIYASGTTITCTVGDFVNNSRSDGYIYLQYWNGSSTSAVPSISETASISYTAAVAITIGDAGYATMMLPFAASIPDGMKVYTATVNDAKNAVVLTEANSIAANTPYIVSGTAGTYNFYGNASAEDYSYTYGALTGTYESTLTVSEGDYILYKNGENVGFYMVGSSVTINQCHAYLPASAVSGSEAKLRFVFADDATGIKAIATEAVENGAIYNLSGQRVGTDYKGIVIKNGKKYLVK